MDNYRKANKNEMSVNTKSYVCSRQCRLCPYPGYLCDGLPEDATDFAKLVREVAVKRNAGNGE